MKDLQPLYDMLERSIARTGINPKDCRSKEAGSWSLTKGSVVVFLDLWHIEKEGRAYFQVMSPVMKVPSNELKRYALFEELLKVNDKLYGAAFTMFNDKIWLKVLRECEGLDETEAYAMISRVGHYADRYDDELIARYSDDNIDRV